ncbi:MAG: hypothetical protein ACPG77_01055 [Nannocystaceae bacterium]
MRGLFLTLVPVLTLFAGCSHSRPPIPMGPVSAAPTELQGMRIHVHNATSQAAQADGEDDVTGYTMMVRGAVQEALVKAGYVVVVDDRAPRDVVAVVQTDYQSRGLTGGELVAALTLWTPAGQAVVQLAGSVLVDKHSRIAPDDAVQMIHALSRNPRTQAYAAKLNEPVPNVPCSREQAPFRASAPSQGRAATAPLRSGRPSTGTLAAPHR